MLLKKYIPENWDDIIGQSEITRELKKYKKIEDMPHLMFIGKPGIGKTACTYVLANSLGVDIKELNASDERGIDTIRNTVKTLLFTSGKRIILMDEFDSVTIDAMAALRRPMELALQKTNNRLILTVNRSYKIIDPILSRCANFYFKPLNNDNIQALVIKIFKGENIQFKKMEDVQAALKIITEKAQGDARQAVSIIEKVIGTDPADIISVLKRETVEVKMAEETFNYAVKGDWENCLRNLENLLISQQTNETAIIEMLWKGLETIKLEPTKKFPLYKALADTERAIKIGSNPLIQFSGFLMTVIGVTYTNQ